MSTIETIPKENIEKYLQDAYGLICFSSFEDRCLTVSCAIHSCKILKAFVLVNIGKSATSKNRENANKIKDTLETAEIVEVNIDNPIIVANCILKVIDGMLKENIENILIDISTFTHEALLILLRLLHDNNNFNSIYCLYNGAADYSVGDKTEQVWLSKGCRDLRNVIGFPGVLKPSKKNHLIILSGFEVERATRLIEVLEPDILSLGEGEEPTDNNHKNTMEYFRNRFEKLKNGFQSIETNTFRFSCNDVEKTVETLIKLTQNYKDENYIIVPLNTKLSTLAVGLVALKNKDMQVCYSIPEVYNTEKYSKSSDNITVIKLSELNEFKMEENLQCE